MNQTFKIGDKVIALSNRPDLYCQPRLKGKTYIVLDVKYCSFCGAQSINVSGSCKITKRDTFVCECNHITANRGLWWTYSKFFIKADQIPSIMEEAIKEEDYEFCAFLRDLQ